MNAMNEQAAIAEGFAEMVEDSEIVIAQEEGELNFDLTPFCEVCGRVTCHVGEHDDLMEAGMIDYNRGGHVGLVTWRKEVTHEQIAAFWGEGY